MERNLKQPQAADFTVPTTPLPLDQIAKQLNTHDRFHADELDTVPSRLDELTLHSRLEQREQHRKGWLRNLTIAAVVTVVVMVIFLAR
ncbi:hypothetical protein [Variovorax soli]|uniref:Uncharacterized protein n=1 Tax=Variovorax soli TaxID=376815 RepID=A0ABU1NMK5_9BURK|nr:hypothetical protein [Variovorax soli]MDR6539690.1 hypothetical protein [Variovorax soli]